MAALWSTRPPLLTAPRPSLERPPHKDETITAALARIAASARIG